MPLLDYVKNTLRRYEIKPRKRFGQSFLIDENVIIRMIEYANVNSKDRVLDVGSGLGFLAELLAEKTDKVIAVESDFKLANILKEKFSENRKIEVYFADFLKLNLKNKFNKVVSSPPYSIASKILFKLLDEKFDLAVLLLQKEFALRMIALPASKDYGRLTVMTYIKAEVEKLEETSSMAFYPKPKVDSTIIRLKPRERPFKISDMALFEKIVKFMFTQRNRKVRNVLQKLIKLGILETQIISLDSIPFLDRRVFTLKPEEFGEITDAFNRKITESKHVRA